MEVLSGKGCGRRVCSGRNREKIVNRALVGRRLAGMGIALLGAVALLGSIYVSVTYDLPVLELFLGVSGVGLIGVGFVIDRVLVRRRISKRGHFRW